ncbi:glycosyltransferase family 2 protein [Morganella morganii]|uniref:glycosyltransferase family 2 protein n=1 Tax=Morganella morganii TaxID=582 RepID=UPI00301B9413
MNNNISVIIPLFNGEDVIIRALNSIIAQTKKVDEIIIINDGSTDNSVTVINNFIDKYKTYNIRVINKENGGVSSARNVGILNAKNEIIAFLDCDDEWLENKLDIQLKHILNSDTVLVGGNHFEYPLKYISIKKADLVNEVNLKNLLFRNYFQPSTVMTKKSVCLKVGCFDENQKYAEEGQFYYKLSSHGKLIHINKQLVIYDGGKKKGFGHSGLSGNIDLMEKGELRNLKYAYKNLNIGIITYTTAVSFSILKYLRRKLLKMIKR